jgi:hypothetical protein
MTHWFEVVGRLLGDPAISKENVYNMDETGVMLSMLGTGEGRLEWTDHLIGDEIPPYAILSHTCKEGQKCLNSMENIDTQLNEEC